MAVNRLIPTLTPDSTTSTVTPTRTDPYGGAFVTVLGSKQAAFAEEGSYFTTYNVTDGTGIAGHAAPVQADLSTKPLLHLFNGNTAKFISVDFIRIRMTAIGAGATTTDVTTWIDRNGASSRSSAGTLATIVNNNAGITNASAAVVYFGPVVATAGTGEVRTDHQRVRSVVPVVEDHYLFTFGGGIALPSSMISSGTLVATLHVPLAPAVIGPGGNFKFVMWGASQSGAHSAEYTIGFTER